MFTGMTKKRERGSNREPLNEMNEKIKETNIFINLPITQFSKYRRIKREMKNRDIFINR